MKELPYTRQQQILERLNKYDCVKIDQLAQDLHVSQMTIYRDIHQLEKAGDVLRVYGGVKAVNKDRTEGEAPKDSVLTEALMPYRDVTIEERFQKEKEAKRAIAKIAASHVKDGDIIAIDPSTTTLHMCSYLQNRNIIVVTTSISVALQFASSKSVDVILCGGLIRKSALSIVGVFVPDILQKLCINKCFLSSHGFTFEDGLTDRTMEESDAKRQLIRSSREVYLLLDHTKMGKYAPFIVCGVDEAAHIITDAGTMKTQIGRETMERCAESGCDIIVAKEKQSGRSRRAESEK